MNNQIRVTPTITKDLHMWIVETAAENHRSLHGQIEHMLEAYRIRAKAGIRILEPGEVVAVAKVENGT